MMPRPPRGRSAPSAWIWAALMAAGLGAAFLAPSDWLPGSPRADLGQQFLAWRAFAAAALRAGRLPGWNPYVYAGEPFLGGFQSALFYPPHLLFVVLPLCRAVNASIALHLLLLGGGMVHWARRRGLHPVAAGLAGIALPLSGPVFPHLYAGHLSNLCTLAWTPWILGGLEAWCRAGGRGLFLRTAAFAGLQILAGHVQYAFYTGIAAAVQTAALALTEPAARRRAPPAVGVYLLALALAAVQLLPALAAADEGLRGGGLGAAFAGQFSLPPENLLTAFAPGFFGGPTGFPYWGRCYWWEMSVFVGGSGMLLAALGAADPARGRPARTGLAIAAVLMLLALGRHTPLFGFLLGRAPGFDLFRGWSKFAFPACVFVVLAAAEGADSLLRRAPAPRWFAAGAVGAGVILGGAGLTLVRLPKAAAPWLIGIRDSGESYLPPASFTDPGTIRGAGVQAGRSLAVAGGVIAAFGTALWLARRRPAFRWVALALLPAEMAGSAPSQWADFRLAEAVPPELRAFVSARPGDYRVQNLVEPNNGFLVGTRDIWGNDPGLPRRYAEFMAYTQGEDPARATQNVVFRRPNALYRLLRLGWIFTRTQRGWHAYAIPAPMSRVQLVPEWRVLRGRDAIFAAMSRGDFEPERTVLLEREPAVIPEARAARIGPEAVRVVSESCDELTVEADVIRPSILLVTDGFSRDWRARGLPGGAQSRYEVLPADYILRATPLAPGHHLIHFEYVPSGLWAGLAVSGAAWASVGLAALWGLRKEGS